jgi:cell division protein FtsB
MSDTALYVSLAANGAVALAAVAKGWLKQTETHADLVLKLMGRVEHLEKTIAEKEAKEEALEGRVMTLEADNLALERARSELEVTAKKLEASDSRSRHLYRELMKLYREATGTHQGITIPPPKLPDNMEDDDEV